MMIHCWTLNAMKVSVMQQVTDVATVWLPGEQPNDIVLYLLMLMGCQVAIATCR